MDMNIRPERIGHTTIQIFVDPTGFGYLYFDANTDSEVAYAFGQEDFRHLWREMERIDAQGNGHTSMNVDLYQTELPMDDGEDDLIDIDDEIVPDNVTEEDDGA